MKLRHIAAICAVALAPLSVHATDAKTSGACADSTEEVRTARLTVIPREVSRTLDMKAVELPTGTAVPLTVGSWWDCWINEHGFEECDYHLAFCTDDGTCVQVH